MASCECCRTKQGKPRVYTIPGKRRQIRNTLCDPCAEGGHSVGFCLICAANGTPAPVWNCGRVAHVAAKHPRTIEKLTNDPFKELAPKPSPYKLGTFYYDKRER